MNLTPWKKHDTTPAHNSQLSGLQQEMNRVFNRFFGEGFPGMDPFTPVFPPVSISENGKTITVTAEIPGMTASELDVSIDGDLLTLRGEKKDERRDEKDNWYRVERSYGSFIRRIELPSAVDAGHAEATLEKGILTLTLAKVANEKSKTIKVQAR